MQSDRLQSNIEIGDIVNIPCVVTAFGGTAARPTVVMTSKYAGYDGNTDSVTTLDIVQVIKDK